MESTIASLVAATDQGDGPAAKPAATLADVVDFYDTRFKIGLTAQEKADLITFLEAL